MLRAKHTPDTTFLDDIYQHESSLRSWLIARFPGVEDLEDVVQEAYFKLIRAHNSGPIVNPRSYLFVTARNIVFNRFRHMKVERPEGIKELDMGTVADDLASPLEEVSRDEEVEILVAAIKSLPQRCRRVITLRKIYGYSMQEVANIMGISKNTVDAQCTIGVRKCAKYLKEHGLKEF